MPKAKPKKKRIRLALYERNFIPLHPNILRIVEENFWTKKTSTLINHLIKEE